MNIYRAGKNNRQEFAIGNAPSTIHDPKSKRKSVKLENDKTMIRKSETNYTLSNGQGVSTGKDLIVIKPCNNDSEDPELL